MVHFEPIPQRRQAAYRDFDRLMVFDGPDEFPILKQAVVVRMARRIIEGTSPLGFDESVRPLREDIPSLVSNIELVAQAQETLRSAADDDLDDPQMTLERRGKMRWLADEIGIASRVYDEVVTLDFDQFWKT